jgi:hypothetical protein
VPLSNPLLFWIYEMQRYPSISLLLEDHNYISM